MGKSNPSARGYPTPTMQSTPLTNREQVGGNTKAGIPSKVGHYGMFVNASFRGASGNVPPPYSGPFWPYAFDNGYVQTPYPLNTTNVLAGGVGMPTGGMFNPSGFGKGFILPGYPLTIWNCHLLFCPLIIGYLQSLK